MPIIPRPSPDTWSSDQHWRWGGLAVSVLVTPVRGRGGGLS